MNLAARELVHRHIIINLTIRTLERDSKYIDHLKIASAFALWVEKSLSKLHEELKTVNKDLYKKSIKIQSEEQGDDGFTDYVFLEKGSIERIRYSNIALRNWVNEEVKRLLNLEHRTTDSGNQKP